MAVLTEDVREKLVEMFGVIAGEEALELFDLRLARRDVGWNIKVVLDRPDGYVTVGDCARLSRRFSARLELERILTGNYKLEVSSPGLDRPLRGPDDYRRFKGEAVKIILAVPSATEVVIGRITAVGDDTLTVAVGEGSREITFGKIIKTSLEIVGPGFGGPKKKRRGKKKGRKNVR